MSASQTQTDKLSLTKMIHVFGDIQQKKESIICVWNRLTIIYLCHLVWRQPSLHYGIQWVVPMTSQTHIRVVFQLPHLYWPPVSQCDELSLRNGQSINQPLTYPISNRGAQRYNLCASWVCPRASNQFCTLARPLNS